MIYVISDIHGEYDLLMALLAKIGFSSNDELIICGDVIDKGRDSVKLLQWVRATPNVRCIIGNHEYAFLKRYWAMMQTSPELFDEVLKMLQSYFPHDGHLLDWDTVDWLETLPYYIEEKDFICVHAGVALDGEHRVLPLHTTECEQFVYGRRFKDADVVPATDKCIFFGHTPASYITNEHKIIKYKRDACSAHSVRSYYKIHLDLGVWLRGVLGCYCVDTDSEYYVQK